MKANKTKQDEDKEFIEKIKSLSITCGAKCAAEKVAKPVVTLIPLGIFAVGYRHPRKLPTDEQSFAA